MAKPPTRPASVSRTIKLGGRSYTLLFNFSALSCLEDLYDTPIKLLGDKFSDPNQMRIKDLTRIVYAGMRAHHPEITEDAVLTLLDAEFERGGTMEDILAETFAAFAAGGEDAPDGDPRKPAGGDADET